MNMTIDQFRNKIKNKTQHKEEDENENEMNELKYRMIYPR